MTVTYNDYNSGHPWFYKLGGKVPSPKAIRAEAKAAEYQGYMAEDILKACRKPEPRRSETLRLYKEKFLSDLGQDISGYRQYAFKLHMLRNTGNLIYEGAICDDVHTNISLKHSHIYNDFTHLHLLESFMSQQLNLFDF